eukprot:Gregarina_sp_Poly_1__1915@NODE_14_length_23033_cov_86_212880_g12_i0_p5_GENE_NODE_14_length_23033_cov_86_212880_g12_i0NODE_14_length_23033_cov_86_212880_g12_i0_p5_ORF_typecomplete_len381_score49_83His_Phos_1/PF00300_22/2_2e12GCR1_C/PF12550_8/1_8e03GCR1_C/PF12550_8/2_2GCR1_C/PF12550_8/3_3e03_NODE_14_length_23033_cov_86_212880_g12_i02184522987
MLSPPTVWSFSLLNPRPSPRLNEKFLILVRHAESKLNATRKEYLNQPLNLFKNGIGHCIDPGVKDAPLTSEGLRQAERAGRKIARDILAGHLPVVELLGVSPLRRTLHTSRLVADSADTEVRKVSLKCETSRIEWWKSESTGLMSEPRQKSPISRRLVIVPYLRERKTTSADQPCVRPAQAVEFWRSRPVSVHVLHPHDLPPAPKIRASTPTRLNHFFTIGLTKGCRKVQVESVDNVSRRIFLLESWLQSRPEKVVMLVGHNMIFKAWQRHWQDSNENVQWASREDIISAMEEGKRNSRMKRNNECGNCCEEEESAQDQAGHEAASSTTASSSSGDDFGFCEFDRVMKNANVNRNRKIYECANTGILVVRWSPQKAPGNS